MTKNYFISENKNLESLHNKLILWFENKEYEVDAVKDETQYLIQAKKTGTFRTFTGTNQAFKVKIYWADNSSNKDEFIVETTIGEWTSNLAGAGVTAMVTGGFTLLTGLAGAGWALFVEDSIIDYIENTLKYKYIGDENDITDDDQSNSINIDSIANKQKTVPQVPINTPKEKAEYKVKQEINKLNKAYKEGILTQKEFEIKKENLEKQVKQFEIDFIVEEKSLKLKKAFSQDILTKEEYELKLRNIRSSIEESISKKEIEEKNLCHMINLKKALDNGILTQAEYELKLGKLQPESTVSL